MTEFDLIRDRAPRRCEGMVLVPTEWIQDSRLSWNAKGLLVDVISRDPSPGSPIGINELMDGQAGSPEFFEAIDELVQAGYIHTKEAA